MRLGTTWKRLRASLAGLFRPGPSPAGAASTDPVSGPSGGTDSLGTPPPGGLPDDLDQQREAAIWLRSQAGGTAGLTRLGGLPSLPSDLEWPRHGQSGTPLHFLAQVDLSRLPPLDGAAGAAALPRTGLLFFFADMVEEMLWGDNGGPFATTRVLFADRAGAERAPPDDIPEILHGFEEKAGGYETGINVYPQAALEPHAIDSFAGMDAYPVQQGTHSWAAQAAMVASIERAIGPIPVFSGPGSQAAIEAAKPREYIQEYHFDGGVVRRELCFPRHQMLGIGKDIQRTAENARADGTILLLQIDTDLSVHDRFQFCDMGVAQFWIEPADLAARRFDRAWGTTEGG